MKMRALQSMAARPVLPGSRVGEFSASLGRDLIRLVRERDADGVKLLCEEAKGTLDPNVIDKHGQRESQPARGARARLSVLMPRDRPRRASAVSPGLPGLNPLPAGLKGRGAGVR